VTGGYVYSVKLGQQRTSSPKFVVTLDGAASESSLTEMDTIDSADSLITTSSVSARNVVRVKPQTQPLTTLPQGSNPLLLYLFTSALYSTFSFREKLQQI